jgi:hypothetical protein
MSSHLEIDLLGVLHGHADGPLAIGSLAVIVIVLACWWKG